MSRTLSRLRDVTGDPILVRAGRNMVLTPWAEATRSRQACSARGRGSIAALNGNVLRAKSGASFLPSGQTMVLWWRLGLRSSQRLPTPRRTSVYASRLSRKKRRAIFGKGWLIWRLAFRVIWGQKYGCNDCLRIGLLASCVKGTRWLSRQK